jgi:dihydroceramidase
MSIRPSLRNKYGKAATLQAQNGASMSPKESEKNSKRDEQILRDMWWMIAIGLSVFLGGFGLWTIDNKYCSQLRRWRRAIGLPWGILLEGHGWW